MVGEELLVVEADFLPEVVIEEVEVAEAFPAVALDLRQEEEEGSLVEAADELTSQVLKIRRSGQV